MSSETEEETVAFQKKRSRRVSFAENTSVHIFDRDDELETPPDPKLSPSPKPSSSGLFVDFAHYNKELGFRPDSSDPNNEVEGGNGGGDDDDDDDVVLRSHFLRPMESPSSGSGFGSATSNDEDHFFGPVSASFIRPGRLSDSAPSDDNHELTMDSTAFSMNFRSLAKSDSGGDLLSSTGIHLSFEDKTPTHDSLPTNQGNSMVLTVAKRPNSPSSMSMMKSGNIGDSNEMSLVGENSRRYDYGRLSPGLDKLLAETSNVLHTSDQISYQKVQRNIESNLTPTKNQMLAHMDKAGNEDKEIMGNNTRDSLTCVNPVMRDNLDQADGDSDSPNRQYKNVFSLKSYGSPVSDVSLPIQSTTHMQVGASEKSNTDDLEKRPFYLSSVDCGTVVALDNKSHQLGGLTSQEWRSPLPSSISSLSKQRQTDGGIVSQSKSPGFATPMEKQVSFVKNEVMTHGASASSIQKSISKLELLAGSPFSSALSAKIDSSNLRSFGQLSRTPLNSVMETNMEGTNVEHVSRDGVETSFSSFSDVPSLSVQQKVRNGNANRMGDSKNEILVHMRDPSHNEELRSPLKNKRSPSEVSTGIMTAGKVRQPYLLRSEKSTEVRFVSSGINSSLMDTALEENNKTILEMESNSIGYNCSQSRELNLHAQSGGSINYNSSQDVEPKGNVGNATDSTATADRLHSVYVQSGVLSSSPIKPIFNVNNFKASPEVSNMDDGEDNILGTQDNPGTVKNSPTSLRHKEVHAFQSMTPDRNFQTELCEASLRNALPEGVGGAVSRSSTSPFRKSANDPSLRKNLVELFAQKSPLKELQNATQNSSSHSIGMEDELSPKSNQLSDDLKNSSTRKRTNEEIIPSDETAGIKRSPKLRKRGIGDQKVIDHPTRSNCRASTIGPELNWLDIYSKISGSVKKLLSRSADKLNIQEIDVLEDILAQLLKKHTYEMLCIEMQSQKTMDPLNNYRQKRLTETKLHLRKLVHEQAKLQLIQMKREIYLKKVQLLRSRTQESQLLKSNHLLRAPLHSLDVQANDGHSQPVEGSKMILQHEASHEKVTAMRQALDDSERRIQHLTKSFHMLCKLKGEPGSADTIVLVNEHLMRRTCCQFLRCDLQSWDIDNLEGSDGYHIVVLRYLSFITQRLTISSTPLSIISISNELNMINIIKNLPDMDACPSFISLFNTDSTRKYIGPKSLAEETQITSSLLGNMLDVVEEVQLARIELQNLIESTFSSKSVEQLDLQLCFIDFKSGSKTRITFDLSCLKSGIYPSEVLPSQMTTPAEDTQINTSQQLLPEVRAAFQNLRVGYLRIIRACRCISQVIEASSR